MQVAGQNEVDIVSAVAGRFQLVASRVQLLVGQQRAVDPVVAGKGLGGLTAQPGVEQKAAFGVFDQHRGMHQMALGGPASATDHHRLGGAAGHGGGYHRKAQVFDSRGGKQQAAASEQNGG